jgi:HSP20 family protein
MLEFAHDEGPMTKRSHTAGQLPQAHARPRWLANKIADWSAPKADAAMAEDSYEITPELRGVAADDIQVLVQDGALHVQGRNASIANRSAGRTSFLNARLAHPAVAPLVEGCRRPRPNRSSVQ